MSKISEYIKLIPKGLKNPLKVLEGILNNENIENLPKELKEVIVERRLICAACPDMSENAKKLRGFKTSRVDEFCILCSCPILTKTASLTSACGAFIYNKSNPKDQKEVKWLAYDYKKSG